MRLYFITANTGKFAEVKKIIPHIQQKDIDLPEIQEINPKKIITHKLEEALKHVDGECLVEDTSLYFNSLNGLPGPLIKWFLKALGLKGLYNLSTFSKDKTAVAKTILGYAKNQNQITFFEGEIKGSIVNPKGNNGFGWDPIFKPNGSDKTFAEMTLEEKMKFGMRRIAAEKLKKYLNQ
ncbi:non-canonical purine NTP pyrophosphatase [Candidatus Roizmanbacteria bacterium]|nr:non-canonical purine NTP pyrophosphatase [Candidatus Roizmanbacteria bacterium]